MKQIKANNYRRHIGIAYCSECNDIMISKGGGIFVKCGCGESFIDQERFDGAYVRLGGNAVLIEQICSSNCTNKDHRKNQKEEKPTQ